MQPYGINFWSFEFCFFGFVLDTFLITLKSKEKDLRMLYFFPNSNNTWNNDIIKRGKINNRGQFKLLFFFVDPLIKFMIMGSCIFDQRIVCVYVCVDCNLFNWFGCLDQPQIIVSSSNVINGFKNYELVIPFSNTL